MYLYVFDLSKEGECMLFALLSVPVFFLSFTTDKIIAA